MRRGRSFGRDGGMTSAPSVRDWQGFRRIKMLLKGNPGRAGRGRSELLEVYRHFKRYGTTGMTHRQLQILRKEMDLDQRNPRGHRGSRRKNRRHRSVFESTSKHGGRFRFRRGRIEVPRGSYRGGYIHGRRNPSPVLLGDYKGHSLIETKRNEIQIDGPGGCWLAPSVATAHREIERANRELNARPRANPKRDGTATRGEKRRANYLLHLESLVTRGEEMKAKLKLVKKAPIGKKTPHHYVEPSPLRAEIRAEAMVPAQAQVDAIQHSEDSEFAEQMRMLNGAHGRLQQVLRDKGEAISDAEHEQLINEISSIAKQKKALRAKYDKSAAVPATASNPGRRRHRWARTHHLIGLRSYTEALRRYNHTLERICD